jgi:glycosyltransferase involved in cell wall biosynthesis
VSASQPLLTISLVTCSYQQGRFIGATLKSVLEQAYPALEYLVVDGGSRDETVQRIREHEAQLAWWVSEPDGGQTDALVKGFARCTGEVMGWLCSDDLLLPGALDRVGRYFRDHPEAQWVYGDAIWIDAAGRPLRPKREMPWSRTVFLFDHNYLAQPSVFWRRSLYEKVGGLDRRWNLAMDADLWLRFANVSRPRHLRQYLSCMRYYPEQKTRALKPAGRREDESLRRREAPLLSAWPRWPLRALARSLRVGTKAAWGGYATALPADVRPWLRALEIASS